MLHRRKHVIPDRQTNVTAGRFGTSHPYDNTFTEKVLQAIHWQRRFIHKSVFNANHYLLALKTPTWRIRLLLIRNMAGLTRINAGKP